MKESKGEIWKWMWIKDLYNSYLRIWGNHNRIHRTWFIVNHIMIISILILISLILKRYNINNLWPIILTYLYLISIQLIKRWHDFWMNWIITISIFWIGMLFRLLEIYGEYHEIIIISNIWGLIFNIWLVLIILTPSNVKGSKYWKSHDY